MPLSAFGEPHKLWQSTKDTESLIIETDLADNPDAKAAGTAVIFVHGLSGSAKHTWSNMTTCLQGDPDFGDVAVDYYSYPTRLLRLPFTPPLPGLRQLSDGLKTFLEERHGSRSSIHIVAHSLGGLIVRHMVTSAIRTGTLGNIKKIALLAVPNTGATLANIGSLVSFSHRQLKSLCKDEQGLSSLNIDWEQLKVEDKIQVRYIMGGSDRTVPTESAAPYIGRDNKSVLINADHRSIVAPDNSDDIRYKTVKRFLIGEEEEALKTSAEGTVATFERPADPLFDVYTPKNEPYYIVRGFDNVLLDVLARGHVWLTGESGIGKSAAARRAVYSSGWRLYHISLSGHEIGNAQELFSAMCSEILALAGHWPASGNSSFSDQASSVKQSITALRSDKVIANVIEEMPIAPEDLGSAADTISRFLDLIDSDDKLYGQVRFVFSSRLPISTSVAGLDSKAREKIQFLPVESWSEPDIARLVKLLAPAIKPDLSPQEQSNIAIASKGSPRFVKMTFRHWRNGTSNGASVDELCARVDKELVL